MLHAVLMQSDVNDAMHVVVTQLQGLCQISTECQSCFWAYISEHDCTALEKLERYVLCEFSAVM